MGGASTSNVLQSPPPCPSPTRGEGTSTRPGTIWRDGAFQRDAWVKAEADAALPDGQVILPKKRWLAEREQLGHRNAPLGLLVEAGETIDDIAADLPRFALIALSFPKFRDGRAFSTARLLREKHGFAGELRAVGNVLSDLIPFMRRVGFDAFEVTHAPTRRALSEGRIPEVALHYQPAAPGEPPRRPAAMVASQRRLNSAGDDLLGRTCRRLFLQDTGWGRLAFIWRRATIFQAIAVSMNEHDPMQPSAARPRLYLQVAAGPAQAGRHAGDADAGPEGLARLALGRSIGAFAVVGDHQVNAVGHTFDGDGDLRR